MVTQGFRGPCWKFLAAEFFAAENLAEMLERRYFSLGQLVLFSHFSGSKLSEWSSRCIQWMKQQKIVDLFFSRNVSASSRLVLGETFRQKKLLNFSFPKTTLYCFTSTIRPTSQAEVFTSGFQSLIAMNVWIFAGFRWLVSLLPQKFGNWNEACISTVLAKNITVGFVDCIWVAVSFRTISNLLHRQKSLFQ